MRYLKAAALAAFIFLAGCAAVPQPADFAATATKICSVVQPTLASVQTMAPTLNPPLSADDQTKLNQASNVVNVFCGAAANADAISATGMLNTAFPLLMSVVANSSLPDNSRSTMLLGIAAVQTATNVMLAQ